MATSAAFTRNVPVSALLDTATWRSSTVFTSFYLRDVQFESSRVFFGSGGGCVCGYLMWVSDVLLRFLFYVFYVLVGFR